MLKRVRVADLVFWMLVVVWVVGFGFALSASSPAKNEPPQNVKCGKAGEEYPEGHYWKCLWERTTGDPVSFYTLALVFFAGGQAALFFWQLGLIRDGLVDTKNAADAALEQARTASQQFIASNRPKLIVRQIQMLVWGRKNNCICYKIRYTIANIGASTARIVESESCLLKLAELHPYQRVEGANEIVTTEIPAGGNTWDERGGAFALTPPPGIDARSTYFRGVIIYIDDNGVRRRTEFCRRYNEGKDHFEDAGDPDYEYAD